MKKKYILGFFLKKECLISFIIELCLYVIILLQAPLISNFINETVLKKDRTSFFTYIIYFVLWGLFYIIFAMIQRIAENNFKNKHRNFLVDELVKKMINAQDIYSKNTNDELKAFFEIDIPIVISSGFLVLKSILINLIFVIVCVVLLANISWMMTGVVLGILLISYIGELYLSSKLNRINYNLREEDVKIQGFFSEGIEKWEEIRNHNMENFFQNMYYSVIDKYISFMNKWVIVWENRNLYMDMKKIILQYVLVYAIGGIFVGQKILESSSLILYGQIFITMFGFIDTIVNAFNNVFDARVNFSKLYDFFKVNECKKIREIKEGDIQINNIYFGYDEKEKIFQNYSCEIMEKKINVLVGDNGIGKSSLCKIIMGILEVQRGNICINGEILDRTYSLLDSGFFSLYSESCGFFHATLSEIIGACKDDIYEKYLDYFQLNQRISKFENGICTEIIDENILSGGEKQRIFLIRSFLSNAKVIIFDEPTSALDRNNIKLFAEKMCEMKGRKTVILITHDCSLKKLGDNIINLIMR